VTHAEKHQWTVRRQSLRRRVVKVLDDIRDGHAVDELDLAKLHNFCMIMLMVLSKVTPGTLNAATKEAELASLLLGQDCEVVSDYDIFKEPA
jgi:hypothetical protein